MNLIEALIEFVNQVKEHGWSDAEFWIQNDSGIPNDVAAAIIFCVNDRGHLLDSDGKRIKMTITTRTSL